MINSVKAHSFDPIFVADGVTTIYEPRDNDPANRIEVLLGPNMRFATTFETWAAGYGLVADPLSDDDADGLALLFEYAFGTNPTVGEVSSNLPSLATSFGSSFTFQRFEDRTDISYVVEYSDNLLQWSEIAQSVDGAATVSLAHDFVIRTSGFHPVETTVTHQAPSNPIFWRLSIR
jgi:hypothetical protein